MADTTKIDFNELDDDAKEALTPRGEYLHPEMLDQGTSQYSGAPTGPVPDDDEDEKEEPEKTAETEKPAKASRKAKSTA